MKLAIQAGLTQGFAVERALQLGQQRPHQIDGDDICGTRQLDQRVPQPIVDQRVRDEAACLLGLCDHTLDLRDLTHIAHGDHGYIVIRELRQHCLYQLFAAGTYAARHDIDRGRCCRAPFA